MYCQNCGKSLGTNRINCPHCGAMISKEQIDLQKGYQQDQKEKLRAQLISEKYGQTMNYEENNRNNTSEKKWIGVLVVLGVLIVLSIIIIFAIK